MSKSKKLSFRDILIIVGGIAFILGWLFYASTSLLMWLVRIEVLNDVPWVVSYCSFGGKVMFLGGQIFCASIILYFIYISVISLNKKEYHNYGIFTLTIGIPVMCAVMWFLMKCSEYRWITEWL